MYDLPYFPPQGTKWAWDPKRLNYDSWCCSLHNQKEPKLDLAPMRVILYVDLIDDKFEWRVKIIDFQHNCRDIKGTASSGLDACLAAEKIGEAEIKKLLPKWAKIALSHGWRPKHIKIDPFR